MTGVATQVREAPSSTPADEVELTLHVHRRRELADGVIGLTLTHPDGEDLPAWEPGAHIDVILDTGVTRQYSLCGDPEDRSAWEIAVLLETPSRGGSSYLHRSVSEGSPLRVRGPRNHFRLHADGPLAFVAGGIGITPLLPMLREADAAGVDWQLHYAGRSRSSMAFVSELQERYGDRVRVHPRDEVERMDLAALITSDRAGAHIYACGPGPLLTALEAQWGEEVVHSERFTPREDVDLAPAGSFDVELERSGLTLHVPEDRSVLEVVRSAGVSVLSSCSEGTCGTCETVVLEGEVAHRDSILTAEERAANDIMYICVSRARGKRLLLDL
ncbi:PDR/VanB family oxidoreductase [Microbacterium sp. RD1]|uniref:PDR/VanB family oxidoreductase n=1 Tax=Microbacterium sp. RD1 TaxID=3457313 RepID=UPI003FA5E2FF